MSYFSSKQCASYKDVQKNNKVSAILVLTRICLPFAFSGSVSLKMYFCRSVVKNEREKNENCKKFIDPLLMPYVFIRNGYC